MNHNKNVVEVLLVEDNPSDVELTLRALKKRNIANRVHVVNDGEEALDFVFNRGKYKDRNINERLKFILLDLKLPKIDGIEVIKALKSDNRTKSIPIVIMTSSKEEEDLVKSYKLGVNSYIVKPLDFSQFQDIVEKIGYYWLLVNELPQP